MWRRDRMIAAAVALVLNAYMVWQLQALLLPIPNAIDEAAAPLQVVWIAAPERPGARGAGPQVSTPPSRIARTPAQEVVEIHREIPTAPAVDPTPTRPMVAVYLQQARQLATQQPDGSAPVDPFATRPVALAHQTASRFRLATTSPADVVAKVGVLFGGAGYSTDDCGAIDDRLLGQVVAGDTASVQQDLDYERRNCRR
jgi:hypothetical protein